MDQRLTSSLSDTVGDARATVIGSGASGSVCEPSARQSAINISLLDFLDSGAFLTRPDATWLKERDQTWTLGSFHAWSQRVGSALVRAGIRPRSVVAVLVPGGADMLAADFGILRAGAAFMNIDSALPPGRLAGLLVHVRPQALILASGQVLAVEPPPGTQLLLIDELSQGGIDEELMRVRRRQMVDTDPACLITTSGSTGVPKAVSLPHRGLVDFGKWFDATFDFSASDVVGSLSPLFFDGYIPGLLMSLYHGGRFVILPREHASFPARLVEDLARNAVSFIFWVPSTLVPLASFRILDELELPALRFVGFAGEVMPPLPLAYLRERLPQARFVNFYGPIETSVICTAFEVPVNYPADKALPIGQACSNSEVLLLNEDQAPCAPGEHGELCVRGSCLAHGYWNDPERTAERFVQNPLQPSIPDLIYRTGDIAFRDGDGDLHFVGRRDFQIKHQGYRIDLAEIEFVVGVSLELQSVLVVYDREARQIIACHDDARDISLAELRHSVQDRLPRYMLPHALKRISPLPLNPNGKFDRVRLAEIVQSASL